MGAAVPDRSFSRFGAVRGNGLVRDFLINGDRHVWANRIAETAGDAGGAFLELYIVVSVLVGEPGETETVLGAGLYAAEAALAVVLVNNSMCHVVHISLFFDFAAGQAS